MLVGLWQLFRPVFEHGEFAFGIAAVQTNGEAASARSRIDDQQFSILLIPGHNSLQTGEVGALIVVPNDGQQFGLADGRCRRSAKLWSVPRCRAETETGKEQWLRRDSSFVGAADGAWAKLGGE